MTGRHALILGAGVAGLSAALMLGRAGWRTTVVEQAPSLRTDGYMIGLSGPGHRAAQRMGLLPALVPRARDIRENVYRDRRGRELLRVRYHDLLQGIDWITLARTDLVEVLHASLDGSTALRLGSTLADFVQEADGVRATLDDGTVLEADLLIGADGAHSALRRMLFGPDGAAARPLGYRAAAFQIPDRHGLGEDFLSYAEPGRLSEVYTLADGTLATLYAWRCTDTAPVPPAERRGTLRTAFAGTHPEALGWIDDLPDGAPIYMDALTMIDLPAWSQGCALLLGDAAHCLTLVSGQGAGMAMTSACVLAEELAADGDVPAALARHEARLRPAIARLQAHSARNAAWFVPATPMAFAVRNAAMRLLPRRLLARWLLSAVRTEIRLAEAPAA